MNCAISVFQGKASVCVGVRDVFLMEARRFGMVNVAIRARLVAYDFDI